MPRLCHSTRSKLEWLMEHGEFASGAVLPSGIGSYTFLFMANRAANTREVFIDIGPISCSAAKVKK